MERCAAILTQDLGAIITPKVLLTVQRGEKASTGLKEVRENATFSPPPVFPLLFCPTFSDSITSEERAQVRSHLACCCFLYVRDEKEK